MAELDLKDIWNKGASATGADELDVEAVIGQKSKTLLDKIKFILKIEFWLNNILTPLGAIYYFQNFGFWSGIAVLVVAIIYFSYYMFLIKAISNFDFAGDVRESLSKLYRYLKFYLLHYKVIIWVTFVGFAWAALGYGFYLGYTGQASEAMLESAPKIDVNKTQAYILLGVMVIIPVLFAILLHYLTNLIYGVKIKKLKLILSDFKED